MPTPLANRILRSQLAWLVPALLLGTITIAEVPPVHAAGSTTGATSSVRRWLRWATRTAGKAARTVGRALRRAPRVPTDIGRIGRMRGSLVLRNLLITQRYHDLSAGLARLLGKRNVNWFAFATWASKTAGESIRKETLTRTLDHLDRLISRVLPPSLSVGRLVLGVLAKTGLRPVLERALDAVSAAISAGNLKVFRDLAGPCADFIRMASRHRRPDEGALHRFLDRFQGSRRRLAAAFEALYRAIFERNATRKARLVLLSSGLLGIHEQTALQPEIKRGLEAPVDEIIAPALRKLVPAKGFGIGRLRLPPIKLEPLLVRIRKIFREQATRMMMTLRLPRGRLNLGKDIPPRRGRSFLPRELRHVRSPAALVTLLARYDRVPGNTNRGTAARDWARLADRMNFIVNLFQSRQHDRSLLRQPFSRSQRRSIERRRIPGGDL